KHPFIVMIYDLLEHAMLGCVSLYNNISCGTSPSGTTTYLRQQRKASFNSSNVRLINQGVCIDNSNNGNLTKVQSFCYHLGTNKHIELLLIEVGNYPFEAILPPCGIQI